MATLVCFTMDNLSDAADLGRGVIDRPRGPGERPALEQGFPAMLALYERFGLSITHFVEGWNGEAHPEAIRELLERGHQLGMHGWLHESWKDLDREAASSLAAKATAALEQAAGIRPAAFRAPGGAGPAFTAEILAPLGYTIDASLPASGAEGGPPRQLNAGLWSVPYRWAAVDATHWLWNKQSAAEAHTAWRAMLDDAAAREECVVFIWHPHIMGLDRERLDAGARILDYVTGNSRFKAVTLETLVNHYAQ